MRGRLNEPSFSFSWMNRKNVKIWNYEIMELNLTRDGTDAVFFGILFGKEY